MPFDSILGHRIPVRILRSMLKTGQIPHAFIFSGVDGIGKRTTAVSFVKALNCLEMEDDFCDRCLSCQKVNRLVHPDIFFVEPEKNVLRIEQVRAFQRDISFKPLEAKKKAVIIDQAEKLNSNAANCLLKTLEEPPEDTVLILVVAGSTAGMLPTILSRCQRICFAPLPGEDIFQFLSKNGVEKAKAGLITNHAYGSIKRANILIESDFLNRRNEIAGLLSGISPGSFDSIFELSSILNCDNSTLFLIFEFLQTWYRDMLLLKEGLSESLLYNRDITESIRDAAENETRDGIIKKIKRIQWLQSNLLMNMDVQMGLESALMQTN